MFNLNKKNKTYYLNINYNMSYKGILIIFFMFDVKAACVILFRLNILILDNSPRFLN